MKHINFADIPALIFNRIQFHVQLKQNGKEKKPNRFDSFEFSLHFVFRSRTDRSEQVSIKIGFIRHYSNFYLFYINSKYHQ